MDEGLTLSNQHRSNGDVESARRRSRLVLGGWGFRRALQYRPTGGSEGLSPAAAFTQNYDVRGRRRRWRERRGIRREEEARRKVGFFTHTKGYRRLLGEQRDGVSHTHRHTHIQASKNTESLTRLLILIPWATSFILFCLE